MKLPKGSFKKHWNRQHGRCYYCGCDLNEVKIEIDHINPFSKSRDGTNQNLCLSCKSCNRIKSDKYLYEFRQIIKDNYPEKLIRGMFYFQLINIHPYG